MGGKKKTSGQAYIDYWKDRALQREALYQGGSQKTIAAMNRAYSHAFDNIQKQVESVVQNLGKKGGASAPDADAYYYRLDTLKALQDNVYDELKRLEDIERKATTTRYADVMREGYYRTMFDIQKGTKLAFDFAKLPKKAIKETMLAGWKGRNYSKSIWQNTEKLAGLAEEIIKGGFLSGAPIQTMVSQLDDVMNTGQFICERLIRSETNYFANQGELRSYEQAGIEKYEFLATLDERTSMMCAGLDSMTFYVNEAVVGKNYPPCHAFCRSTTVAHFDDDVVKKLRRRARDPVTGKTILLDKNMEFYEWYDKYVRGKTEAEAVFYAQQNKSSDKKQFDKYSLIFGKDLPASLEEFQKMKYTDNEKWERIKALKQETLNTLDYRKEFDGVFGNIEVRQWYIAKNKDIINRLDADSTLEWQARQAHELRNMYKQQARNMMADREEAEYIEKKYPLLSFNHYFEKYSQKSNSIEAAYHAIIEGSARTNKDVNRLLNLE